MVVSKLQAGIDRFGRGIGWMTLVMVVITFVIVLLRYVFNIGWIWLQESVVYTHATVFMLGIAWALYKGGHVRVDIFYRTASPRRKALIDLTGTILFIIPLAVFVLWTSWEYVASSWRLLEGSREAGGLPLVFVLKSLIPAFALLLLAQAILSGIGYWQTIRSR